MSALLWQGPLLTSGGASDPLLPKLVQAINHATEIEISVAFIQPSGLELLLPALEDALTNGAQLSILTSDYLLITSPRALRQLLLLAECGARVRLFCCKPDTGFHMKAYIFTRSVHDEEISGCAYIGSSNISKTALTLSHEWSLRYQFHGEAIPADYSHIREQFLAIFSHSQSLPLNEALLADYTRRFKAQQVTTKQLSMVGVEKEPETIPNSAQQDALELLAKTRAKGYQRGLVVLATGMGKTWLAAFDVMQMGAARVLFVAHREEILHQAQRTFSWLLPAKSSGLYVGSGKNAAADMVFASVQTLSQADNLQKFAANHFDYIVIDEFHHAAGRSYQAILSHFRAKFLLGLTATPERTDQADILALCDHNLVYQRNVVHGIEEGILVPFHYHGLNDPYVNYQEIPWRHGRFDPTALDSAFATQQRAKHIFRHWQRLRQSRTLAFCISRRHADFMTAYFGSHGVKAAAVYQGSVIRRNEALQQLEAGKLEVVFSVDLFNEGTDLPAIDTVLMLRPTESKILFLQQLGRGLRQSPDTGKQHLVVVDFIGNHRSFLLKPATLFQDTATKKLAAWMKKPPTLADGCYINFAPEVIDYMQQLARSIRNTALEDLQQLADELGHRPSAVEFFEAGYDFAKVRKAHKSWFELIALYEENTSFTQLVARNKEFLLRGVETTSMSKSFKMILLRAFLELDGFRKKITVPALAERSWHIIWRRPDWARQDIKAGLQSEGAQSPKWLKYWSDNPIKFYCAKDQKDQQAWFRRDGDFFQINFKLDLDDFEPLVALVDELIDLRLAQYAKGKEGNKNKQTAHSDNVLSVPELAEKAKGSANANVLPFYPDLKIACGHFGQGSPDGAEMHTLPLHYGNLNPERHFIAPAKGNSMNGGKQPVHDGDLLLFEWVTPSSAGSISNNTMAIEQVDAAGDAHYLLREVKKQADGRYLLKATNPNYSDLEASESMRTFARLKTIIDPKDLQPTD